MFENATVAPTFHDKTYCMHVVAGILATKKTGKPYRQRIDEFYTKVKKEVGDIPGFLRRLMDGASMASNGYDEVRGEDVFVTSRSRHGTEHKVDVHAMICDCQDWQNGYSAHIAALKAMGELPDPPIE